MSSQETKQNETKKSLLERLNETDTLKKENFNNTSNIRERKGENFTFMSKQGKGRYLQRFGKSDNELFFEFLYNNYKRKLRKPDIEYYEYPEKKRRMRGALYGSFGGTFGLFLFWNVFTYKEKLKTLTRRKVLKSVAVYSFFFALYGFGGWIAAQSRYMNKMDSLGHYYTQTLSNTQMYQEFQKDILQLNQ
jgi:hypothetical protein